MIKNLFEFIKQDLIAKLSIGLFVGFLSWWLTLYFTDFSNNASFLFWGNFYQTLAIVGGVAGVVISWRWGGLKSVMGRAIAAFAVGLLFQVIGQNIFSYYNIILKVDVPYPSWADLGFFGSIPFYIYGIILLARASGAKSSLRSLTNQIQAVLIPLVGLSLSYYFFLANYEFDWSAPLRVFFDFGYPLGQTIYITIALSTFLISRKVLGGIMKNKIMFVLFALLVQYIADYNFLYQAYNETWVSGHYGDLIYMSAYFVMALALLQLDVRYVSPRLGTVTNAGIGERTWQQLDQVATLIVEGQATIIGPLAWSEAGQVTGIALDDSQTKVYLVGANPPGVLADLASRYERLFGQASREVSRDAVRKIVFQLPQEQIPDVLK